MADFKTTKINNSSNITINPATEDTLSSVIENNIHTTIPEVIVASKGHICTNNSTSTPLGINGVFTGDWQDTLDYSEVIVSVYTDKSSITNGLAIYWSADGITIHGDDFFTISASSGKTFTFPCQNRYVKVVYTNDAVAQTYFVLETLLKRFASKGSSHRLKDAQSQEDDAILTKSMIVGLSSQGGGTIVDVKVNPSGTLETSTTLKNMAGSNINPATSDLQTTLNSLVTIMSSLVETQIELNQRLAFLGSLKQHQTESLRTTVINTPAVTLASTTITSGTITTVGTLTNFGAGIPAKEMADDINNQTATLCNINNVTVN